MRGGARKKICLDLPYGFEGYDPDNHSLEYHCHVLHYNRKCEDVIENIDYIKELYEQKNDKNTCKLLNTLINEFYEIMTKLSDKNISEPYHIDLVPSNPKQKYLGKNEDKKDGEQIQNLTKAYLSAAMLPAAEPLYMIYRAIHKKNDQVGIYNKQLSFLESLAVQEIIQFAEQSGQDESFFNSFAECVKTKDDAGKDLYSACQKVLIFSGDSSKDADIPREVEKRIKEYINKHTDIVISGGTSTGIPGMVGEIAQNSNVTLLGYVPSDKTILEHSGYKQQIRTKGSSNFSVLEPCMYWIDILASNIPSKNVTLYNYRGGDISAFERELAAKMGAEVYTWNEKKKEFVICTSTPDEKDKDVEFIWNGNEFEIVK